MRVVSGRNVNHTYNTSMFLIGSDGLEEDSRAGPVIVMPHPMVTATMNPNERVLFDRARDANPFFHFFECLWMLSGVNDGRWLDRFVSDFSARYAESGGVIHGAYGYRWRTQFGFDQIDCAVEILKRNPADRRVVIAMWDPAEDFGAAVQDVPCNTHIYPRVRRAENQQMVLDLTICCRSNDIIWGATGANAVHFSFLQEVMAGMIGVGIGHMYQLSNNWHAYRDVYSRKMDGIRLFDPYTIGSVRPHPIVRDADKWMGDLRLFMGKFPDVGSAQYYNPFFIEVAVPMLRVHDTFTSGNRREALQLCERIVASDWRLACELWISRRIKR